MTEQALNRRDVVKTILADRGDALVVTGLGSSTWDVFAISPSDRNFYLWGAMGSAAVMGLGLATAQPDSQVIVITGDGEMLMGIGSLATIGVRKPPNLSIVVLDNEHYGETGMQQSHTSFDTSLTDIASANGIKDVHLVENGAELEAVVPRINASEETCFVTVKVASTDPGKALPTTDGVEIKNRFRRAVLGTI